MVAPRTAPTIGATHETRFDMLQDIIHIWLEYISCFNENMPGYAACMPFIVMSF